jgi:type IV pilus assembly protein PilB
MLQPKLFASLLETVFALTPEQIATHKESADKLKKPLELYLREEKIIDEEKLYTAAAQTLGKELITLRDKDITEDILHLIPVTLAETHQLIAYAKTDTTISLSMLDPEDMQTIEFIHRKTGLMPTVVMSTPSEMKEALKRYHMNVKEDLTFLKEAPSEPGDLKKAAEELPVVRVVNSILEHAIYEGASDIHIEPHEAEVIVRYRIDGELKEVMNLPKTITAGIIARIKILSNLKIDEHMIPQDGRFKTKIDEESFAFRVSTIPVYDGEKIVMRILREGQKPLNLDQLGFLPEPRKLLEEAMQKPHGMILVTGPTGSGKTTTLYSVLGILNTPDVNISTVEDPIEYHVAGINQSQINARVNYTFAAGLRAFLRQDPDIIMVGEIRDEETAEVAVHAAMTGHLVLSTLHTNDAPTTLPRLMDMGIPPFLVAFTANIIIAQRLVRKICQYCKVDYQMTKGEIEELEKTFKTDEMAKLFTKHDIKLTAKEKNLSSMTFYRGEGCAKCNKSGYKGRLGIYEILSVDKDIAKLINERATAREIGDFAKSHGMVTILQDGLIKAKQGITTVEEVLGATRE